METEIEIFLPTQELVKSVEVFTCPHGPMIVWESLYPEDVRSKYRYLVTLDGRFRFVHLGSFNQCGFWDGAIGYSKAECFLEAKSLRARSIATQHSRCETDRIFQNRRLDEWVSISSRYQADWLNDA